MNKQIVMFRDVGAFRNPVYDEHGKWLRDEVRTPAIIDETEDVIDWMMNQYPFFPFRVGMNEICAPSDSSSRVKE
jgi:hypothetical protein